MIKRVAVGVYNDGFIHAGNLAYLALLALFPFFILAAAFAQILGQTESGARDRRDDPRPVAAETSPTSCAARSRKC